MQTQTSLIQADNYRFLQDHIYSHSGIVLDSQKEYLLEGRLSPIVRQHGLSSINDLCALLRATREPGIGLQVVEAMTTNETYFFRDPGQYDAIRKVLLPKLKEDRQSTQRLRFWSAAASTGQEAYSLAMLLEEEGFGGWDIRILGTDLASHVLVRARGGKYQQIEVNRGMPAALLVKYFKRSGVEWILSEATRRMANFEQIDLRKSMRALGPFDLVFCRNVMIYFDAATKASMMKELHGTLFRGGWLLLGGAETAFSVEEWFAKQTVGNTTVYVAR